MKSRKWLAIAFLGTTVLMGCATTHVQPTPAEIAIREVQEAREAEHLAQMGYASMTTKPPVSGTDVLKGLATLPIIIPLQAVANYGRFPHVHCRSYTYKDQYHATCY